MSTDPSDPATPAEPVRNEPVPNGSVPNDDVAAVALLLSILGLMGCLPVGATGLAMGYWSRDRIRRSGGLLGGERTARAAIVIGWIAIAVSVLAVLAFLVAALVRRAGAR